MSRHEVLRTVIKSSEGSGYQEVLPDGLWTLEQYKIKKQDKVAEILEEYVTRPFDLSRDHMFRVALYDLGTGTYIMAGVFHHIASDGWSNNILVEEFAEIYQALLSGREPLLAPLAIQYTDYAVWQREHVEGEWLDGQLSYWENQLLGVSNLALPTDYPRPAIQSTAGASIFFDLDRDLTNRLSALAQSEKTTLFMVLLAAFKVLLYRYTGQEDICIGTSVANRTQQELEALIGFFVNIITVRNNLNGNDTFIDLLKTVKSTVLEGYDYQQAPFERVVERTVKTRDRATTPLFQVLFELIAGMDQAEIQVAGMTLKPQEYDTTISKFDLSVKIIESKKALSICLEYATALFKEDTMRRMASHYVEILEAVIQNPKEAVGRISILPSNERELLLEDFSSTTERTKEAITIIDQISQHAKSFPDLVALTFGDLHLSYKDLMERVDIVAEHLKEHYKVEPGDFVGVHMNRSDWYVIATLGILKVGGVYVPIDIQNPVSRKAYMVEDSALKMLIIESDGLFDVIDLDVSVFSIDIEYEGIRSRYSNTDFSAAYKVSSEDTAYAIYTSGTTGRPKGVLVSHGNLLSYLRSCSDYVEDSSTGPCSFMHLSPSFDASLTEFFVPLMSARKLVIGSHSGLEVFNDPNFIKEAPYDFIKLTPSHLELLLPSLENLASKKLASKLIFGGEPLKPSHINSLKTSNIEAVIINEYGPTEATVGCSTHWFELHEYTKERSNSISIGKPLPNTQIYILDEFSNPAPIGIIGEMYVGGSQVAKGYLNNKALTEKKFVKSPITDSDGMFYKTGDLARWLPDGNIEFIGRKDEQLKIRGYRIEPGEIENVLMDLDAVQVACVKGVKDEFGEKLVAYITTKDDFEKDVLEEELRRHLPEYMIPGVWVELDAIPLTANGKIDREALPDPDRDAYLTREYVPPRDEIEQDLAGIWSELLGVDSISVLDDFFALGGHSLLATRLVSMVRVEMEVEIAIRDVFTHSVLEELATHISGISKGVVLPQIVAVEDKEFIPLSYSQERLWFLDQLQGSVEYHIPIVLRLEGSLDLAVFEKSLERVVSRHEVLRTVIKSSEGSGYQEVLPDGLWTLEQYKIKKQDKVAEILEEYVTRPFDLSRDHMFRVALYDLGTGTYIMAGVFHHIASDGWSNNILVEEFAEIYQALLSGREPLLAPLAIQYTDYAVWQREHVEGEWLDGQLSYWENQLLGVSNLALPTDYPRPAIQSTAGASIFFDLDRDLTNRLSALAQSEKTTLFMVLLAAFKVLLYRYTGQEDICIGTPVANRTQQELEALIGFFVNTLALRSSIEPNRSFIETLQEVKKVTLAAYDHQQAPFEQVVERTVKTRDRATTPLFQVMFELQNIDSKKEITMEGISFSSEDTETQTSKFDLTLIATESDSGILMKIEYATSLFREETVQAMAKHYQNILSSSASNPEMVIGKYAILSNAERELILKSFNNTDFDYPKEETIVDLFEKQANEATDNIALVSNEREITYDELDKEANRLARYLLTLGITKETLVGICIDRSPEMVIGILAILKSGGAFVPIDPQYPLERINYILDDAVIKFLLTSSRIEKSAEMPDWIEKISIDTDWGQIAIQSEEKLDSSPLPKDVAYVMYTSGSTGRPKGVMIQHQSLINFLWGTISRLEMSEMNALLSLTTYTFDIFYLELFAPLLLGSKVILQDKSVNIDYIKLQKNIGLYNPDFIQATPSTWQMLTDIGFNRQKGLTILSGGEPLKEALKNRLVKIGDKVWNMYGPTEATIWATTKLVDFDHPVNIGSPLYNYQIYILDAMDQLTPIGIVGELCIGGDSLAKGYLGRPDLDKQKFIAHPFKENERLYRTGDMGRWLSNGDIEFLERRDEQVKVRGHRIELGEIENALNGLKFIKNCTVNVKEDTNGVNRLIAYVICEEELDRKLILDHLKTSLPDYMIPSIVMKIDELPLTSNGKVNKRALPDPELSELSSQPYAPPRNELEHELVQIWQDLLEIERVGILDNFFELGGHSIMAMRLVAQINKAFDKELSIANLFEFPTISLLSEVLFSENEIEESILVPLNDGGAKTPIFCMPPASGTIPYYDLAKLLGDEQPLYAFQCPGLNGKTMIIRTVEELATAFIKEMKKVDPKGPYRLAGYSFGGLIALEMALQLKKEGLEVSQLFVFDTFSPSSVNSQRSRSFEELLTSLAGIINQDYNTSIELPYLKLKNKTKEEQLNILYGLIKEANIEPTEMQIRGHIGVYIGNDQAASAYQPLVGEKLDTQLILIKAEALDTDSLNKEYNSNIQEISYEEEDYGWQMYFNERIVVHRISGTHSTIFSHPHVREIAEKLNKY
ncbi:amino acid adenylation domain-containing protein [Muricauda sp. SCSIO 64092]|uniref:amino acid adenylation domain-containing protein n=1 Tax=Allomuricauda sp. SCSIO 64092 TaxID=2908842 RepID=UPI001FF59E6F|nr:non-ribosomal peptide synthetase [Muricauda sp. SCSIO 64092]UOY09328.1 amino acid adenylation domain-containing protein [Muricauda sp. SCSIO 64092]